jgi:hypothetical protein
MWPAKKVLPSAKEQSSDSSPIFGPLWTNGAKDKRYGQTVRKVWCTASSMLKDQSRQNYLLLLLEPLNTTLAQDGREWKNKFLLVL